VGEQERPNGDAPQTTSTHTIWPSDSDEESESTFTTRVERRVWKAHVDEAE